MPIFRRGSAPYALAVAMTGIRMGERVLWIGAREPAMFGAVAAKMGPVGVSGRVAAIVDDAEGAGHLRQAAARAGILAEIETGSAERLPFDGDSFDLAVLAGPVGLVEDLAPDAQMAVFSEARRVLRAGGRLIVIERFGSPRFLGLIPAADRPDVSGDRTESALQAAGFRPVRTLARREGLLFVEGLKRAG
jgi:ubiquinone/menaquinone biosynthesis C-methylase UbiE